MSERKKRHRLNQRAKIMRRDNSICQYCWDPVLPETVHLDHVTPIAKGGDNTMENMVACCQACQNRKADLMPDELGLPDWHLTRLTPDYLRYKLRVAGVPKRIASIRPGRSMIAR